MFLYIKTSPYGIASIVKARSSYRVWDWFIKRGNKRARGWEKEYTRYVGVREIVEYTSTRDTSTRTKKPVRIVSHAWNAAASAVVVARSFSLPLFHSHFLSPVPLESTGRDRRDYDKTTEICFSAMSTATGRGLASRPHPVFRIREVPIARRDKLYRPSNELTIALNIAICLWDLWDIVWAFPLESFPSALHLLFPSPHSSSQSSRLGNLSAEPAITISYSRLYFPSNACPLTGSSKVINVLFPLS